MYVICIYISIYIIFNIYTPTKLVGCTPGRCFFFLSEMELPDAAGFCISPGYLGYRFSHRNITHLR